RAAVEFLHDELGATTLFATHYHDLTELADRLDRVHNRHFVARREDGDVAFLHRVRDGPASSSYGVEVAEMAGVPPTVVDRARELVAGGGAVAAAEPDGVGDENDGQNGQRRLSELESGGTVEQNGHGRRGATGARGEGRGTEATDGTATADSDPADGLTADSDAPADDTVTAHTDDSSVSPAAREILSDLAAVDLARTTPVEALTTLQELQQRLAETAEATDD
ncbi:MAG: DNA mismatch repair protein MutS, partial [Halobaculum sp.]